MGRGPPLLLQSSPRVSPEGPRGRSWQEGTEASGTVAGPKPPLALPVQRRHRVCAHTCTRMKPSEGGPEPASQRGMGHAILSREGGNVVRSQE